MGIEENIKSPLFFEFQESVEEVFVGRHLLFETVETVQRPSTALNDGVYRRVFHYPILGKTSLQSLLSISHYSFAALFESVLVALKRLN